MRARVGRTEASPVVTVPAMVQPSLTCKAIVLFRAYAQVLQNFFSFHAPIRRQLRPAIVHALARAHALPAGSSMNVHPGEVAIVLPEADAERLHDAIRRHQEYQLPASVTDIVRDAIKSALSGKPFEGAVEAGSVELAASSLVHPAPPIVSSEDSSEVKQKRDRHTEGVSADDLLITPTQDDGRPE